MVDFEHTLFLILLLSGLVNVKTPNPRLAILIIMAGVIFAFFPPAIEMDIPWEFIIGLVLPLLIWQNIRRLSAARWMGWKNFFYWVGVVVFFSLLLQFVGAYAWTGSLLFGMLIASLIWRAGETETGGSYMSLVGTVTLIFLLTEVDIAILSINHYVGGVFSASFIGLLTALAGLYLLKKTPAKIHSWIGIAQVYAAFWLSLFGGISPIAAALVSALVYVWLRRYTRLGSFRVTRAAPLNSWPGFSLILILFIFLGWQSHQPVSALVIGEALIGGLIAVGVAWLGFRLNNPAFRGTTSLFWTGLKIILLLFPSLLIWPRNTIHEPVQLLVAIGLSILLLGISYGSLSMFLPRGDLHIYN